MRLCRAAFNERRLFALRKNEILTLVNLYLAEERFLDLSVLLLAEALREELV